MKKWVLAAAAVAIVGVATTLVQLRKGAPPPSAPPAATPESAPLPPVASLVGAAEPQTSTKKPAAVPAPTVPPNPADARDRSSQAPGKLRMPPLDGGASATPGAKPPAKAERTGAAPAKIRREGSRLMGVAGSIRQRGDRFEFVPADTGPSLVVLENQILERVDAMQSRQPSAKPLVWTVTGLVTEFRGANYLLLDQATIGAVPAAEKAPTVAP